MCRYRVTAHSVHRGADAVAASFQTTRCSLRVTGIIIYRTLPYLSCVALRLTDVCLCAPWVQEVGLVTPGRYEVPHLSAGQVGYVVMGMKTPQEAHIGDTLLDVTAMNDPLPGFLPSKPMVRFKLHR